MQFNRTVIEQVVNTVGSRAKGDEQPELPHPMATDSRLAEHLGKVGQHLIIDEEERPATTLQKLKDRARIPDQIQASFNSRIIHALHQLDHRGLYQRQEIRDLREQLATSNEKIIQLQRRLDRLEADGQ